MSKKLIFASAGVMAVFLFAGIAAAQSFGGSQDIVQRIAERFNLEESAVQEVFNEMREEKMLQQEERVEERLDKFVEDGKITQDQEDQILAKREEIKNLPVEERKDAVDEFREWSKENNIPFGFMGPWGKGPKVGNCPMMGGLGQFNRGEVN